MKFEKLVIGNIEAKLPIIQGGMGVGVSLCNLAGELQKMAPLESFLLLILDIWRVIFTQIP